MTCIGDPALYAFLLALVASIGATTIAVAHIVTKNGTQVKA